MKVYLLILTLTVACRAFLMTPHGGSTRYLNTVVAMCRQYLSPRENVVISTQRSLECFNSDSLLKHLSSDLEQPLLISNSGQHAGRSDFRSKAHYFLVFLHSDALFDKQLSALEKSPSWNPHARFIVVVANPVTVEDQQRVARRIVAILWEKLALNVLVTLTDGAAEQLYTWFPFSRAGKCGKNLALLTVLAPWENLFPEKVPSKLHNCAMRVSTFTFEPYIFDPEPSPLVYKAGIEPKMFSAVAEASGYQPSFLEVPVDDPIVHKWGGRLPNGTWFGALGNVASDKADVAFAAFRPSVEEASLVDVSDEHSRDQCVWFVPPPERIAYWKSIFIIFSARTWLLIVASCLLVSLVFSLAGVPLLSAFSTAWSVLLGISLGQLPSTTRVRLALALWVYCSLVVNTAYQSVLITLMTEPGSERQIFTTEEMVNSDLSYGAYAFYRQFYDNEDYVSRKIHTNLIITYGELDVILRKEKFAFLFCSLDADYARNEVNLKAPPGRVFTPLLDGRLSFSIVFYLRKHSPYTARFNTVFKRIQQAGLLSKWIADLKRKKSLRVMHLENETTQQVVVITLSHLEGAFGLLLVGVCVSTVSLIGELLVSPRKQHSAHLNNKLQ